MKTTLNIDPEALWGKVGVWLTTHDLFGRSAEESALAIIQGKILTDDELAFMLIVATDHLTKPKKEPHGKTLLRN